MEKRQMLWQLKGMNRDLAVSKFNKEFAYENKNLRFVTTEGNTMLAMVTEKGPKELVIYNEEELPLLEEFQFTGTPIGYCVINEYLTLFFVDMSNKLSYIYRVNMGSDTIVCKTLFSGDLGFSDQNPIETIGFYENKDIQKVYWTDGKNQPRVINIKEKNLSKFSRTSFDFIPTLSLEEEVKITKNTISNGEFAPGVIQYCFTYINKYGQQSNIFYSSSLYYCSNADCGESPDGKVSNSFSITISNLDSKFDYVRIYSIHRSSEEGTPYCKCVTDLKIPATRKIHYEDNNLNGYTIDPAELLYVGGENISVGTFASKDNVLFLGDIETKPFTVPEDIKNELKQTLTPNLVEKYAKVILDEPYQGYYPHRSQLDKSSDNIKYFKAGETYRFGLQFQAKNGKWSDVVWLGDHKMSMTYRLDYSYDVNSMLYYLPAVSVEINQTELIRDLLNKGFKKARPVVVFPNINERECVCQGIICPTVYNVSDRASNSPFVQSSWYPRPDPPTNSLRPNPDIYMNKSDVRKDGTKRSIVVDRSGIGKWAEFRHNSSLSSCSESNAEIQCSYNKEGDEIDMPSNNTDKDLNQWVSEHNTDFFVDKSIVTFHSPDIEFNSEVWNRNMDGLQLRIVGKAYFTANVADVDIITETSQRISTTIQPVGFYKEPIGVKHLSVHGWRGAMAMPYWFDELTEINGTEANNKWQQAFVVYPWHRYGSLNNQAAVTEDNPTKTAMIKKKVISNLKVSAFTRYLKPENIWYPQEGISGVTLFNSNEKTLSKIKAPKNSDLEDLNYYGNVDKLLHNAKGYPIMISKVDDQDFDEPVHTAYAYDWRGCGENTKDEDGVTCTVRTPTSWGYDPVRMKYKSTPHAVMAFNYSEDGKQIILPTVKDKSGIVLESPVGCIPFWKTDKLLFTLQDQINDPSANDEYGGLWIGELYNPNIDASNRFGGTSEEAIAANTWVVAGKAINLSLLGFTVEWTEGDTYYQRYDHIKTYGFSPEDYQSLIEIMSFMCETRVNLDGRYDKNRGLTSNLHITPENFNKINNAYNQINDFFTYHSINSSLINPTYYPSTVTWTLQKISGSLVDEWTHITLGASMELDGDKGKVNAIRRFKDRLISFQDSAVSQILFNERAQIPVADGVPIELGNSGKVDGKRYISTTQGCKNKWSICESQSSLYFIDSLNRDICRIDEGITSLSKSLGMHSWANQNINSDIWNSTGMNAFATYYDAKNNDVLFINNNYCLAFSELLGQFTSLYSYEKTPYLINVQSKPFWIRKSNDTDKQGYRLWKHNDGSYNEYFDVLQHYYTVLVANDLPTVDKTFTNLEYTAVNENNQTSSPFDELSVWNEYQSGSLYLQRINGKPSSLKRKFRTWRANIPRHVYKTSGGITKQDRMRNQWLYIKLDSGTPWKSKSILHDIMCDYLI